MHACSASGLLGEWNLRSLQSGLLILQGNVNGNHGQSSGGELPQSVVEAMKLHGTHVSKVVGDSFAEIIHAKDCILRKVKSQMA